MTRPGSHNGITGRLRRGTQFVPSSVPGCELWLDASKLSLAYGASVTSWTDFSGKARNATPISSAPVYASGGPDGHPVVNFPADRRLTTGWTPAAGKYLYAVVWNRTSLAGYEFLVAARLDGTGTTNQGGFGIYFTGSGSTGLGTEVSYGGNGTGWNNGKVFADWASGTVSTGPYFATVVWDESNPIPSLMRIGGANSSSLRGNIAEVLVFSCAGYDRDLVAKLHQYFMAKYPSLYGYISAL